jgi:hypothetical protein
MSCCIADERTSNSSSAGLSGRGRVAKGIIEQQREAFATGTERSHVRESSDQRLGEVGGRRVVERRMIDRRVLADGLAMARRVVDGFTSCEHPRHVEIADKVLPRFGRAAMLLGRPHEALAMLVAGEQTVDPLQMEAEVRLCSGSLERLGLVEPARSSCLNWRKDMTVIAAAAKTSGMADTFPKYTDIGNRGQRRERTAEEAQLAEQLVAALRHHELVVAVLDALDHLRVFGIGVHRLGLGLELILGDAHALGGAPQLGRIQQRQSSNDLIGLRDSW